MVRKTLQFTRFLRRERIDVVQAYFLDSVYYGTLMARLAGVRRVVRVRNNLGYWLTTRHRWLNRVYGHFVDVTLTNSEPGKLAIVESDRVKADRVVVLANGVAVERFAGGPAPDTQRRPVRIGAVANLRPVKGLDVLVEAAHLLAPMWPGVEITIAGEGEQRPDLEALVASRGVGNRVKLPGAISDVPSFLKTLDIAVLPSRSEGMSNALLEYMAAGRAIVATRVGANHELVRDGVDGFVVPPEDPAALADAIARLLADTSLARRLAASAQQRATTEFSRDAARRRYEQFYRRLCQ
jgi:glycosyltransferase involved in cell wall biosynthesis